MSPTELAKEVVIVRRRKVGGEDGHHGGGWKIAYADFMTAMMAFFLVMWLVSMTDDQTMVQVANYFNPIQLTDLGPAKRGVKNADPKMVSDVTPEPESDKKAEAKKASEAQQRAQERARTRKAGEEAKLFLDPADTLDKIEQGEFDAPSADFSVEAVVVHGRSARNVQSVPARLEPQTPAHGPASAITTQVPGTIQTPLRQEMVRSLTEIAKSSLGVAAGLSFSSTSDGLLVSVSDTDDFEMFKSGSAEPTPRAVKLMERLAAVILKSGSAIVVRGYTDAAAFRTAGYDNWRLSTARAHMAHYMLQRAGVPDAKVERIEGYADTKLRDPLKPLAAVNRRIELLLRVHEE